MAGNSEHRHPSSAGIPGFIQAHSWLIPVAAVILTAGIVMTHLDFSEILADPALLIGSGIGLVALHLLGVWIVTFFTGRRRQKYEYTPGTDNSEENIPETRGQTIPWSGLYDRLVSIVTLGKEKSIREKTVTIAGIQPGNAVLDVGCGTGNLTIAAAEQAGPEGEVFGTDAAPKMISQARKKAEKTEKDITFDVGLIEDIDFPDDRFDVVLSSFMMHHLPEDLQSRGLAETFRVLKPRGRILIVDMESSANGSIFRRFSDFMIQLHGGHSAMKNNVQKLEPELVSAGFVSVRTERINRQIACIIGEKPMDND